MARVVVVVPSLSVLCLGASLGVAGWLELGCSPSSEPASSPRLLALLVEGVELSPRFSPEVSDYRAEVSLLRHSTTLIGLSDEGSTIAVAGTPGETNQLSASQVLAPGTNEITLVVSGPNAADREYRISIERTSELWRNVEIMLDEAPRENGYFGDYLRASSQFLYLNSARRGRLYANAPSGWLLPQSVEELFDVELEWMYEAAVTDDALALVAQPIGGSDTLSMFSRGPDLTWLPGGEYPAPTESTIRIAGDTLAFVSSAGISFFERESTTWRLAQELPAPAENVGFGTRPTYFDAPGVALSETTLLVGAPFADTPAAAAGACDSCDEESAGCLRDSGLLFVYARDAAGSWALDTCLGASNPASDLQFGHSASLLGDRIVVGTPADGSAAPGFAEAGAAYDCTPGAELDCVAESGAVSLFERGSAGWQPAGMLKPSYVRAHDYFGDAVLLVGDLLLVAAPGHDGAAGAGAADASAPDAGGIFAFVRSADGWSEQGPYKLETEVAPPYPFPGQMVVSGATLLVSSNIADYLTDDGETLPFAGRVFDLR